MPSSSRERLITEAARLFAAHGYDRTSVADIQLACGLTGGSGALYKHFPSKRALLDAVLDRHIDTMRVGHASFAEHATDDVPGTLALLAEAMFAALQRDRDILRVTLRDLDAFPDLLDRVWSALRADIYDAFTGWLARLAERPGFAIADPQATAAVLLASLTYPCLLHALIGHTPGDIESQRYRDAWVAHALATITAGGAGSGAPH